MAFDPKQFTDSLLQGVTVDDATKAAIASAVANPALQVKFQELEEGNLRQSEFSKKIKAAQDYWDGLSKWDRENKGRLESEVAQLRQQVTSGDGSGLTPPDGSNYKQELQKLAQEAVAYNNTVMQLGLKHFKDFGEILDTNELLKIAGQDQVNISIAYDRFVQPKREERQKVEFDKQLAQAREEGKAEAYKNANLPISNEPWANATPSPLDGMNGAGRSGDDAKFGSLAAVKAFTEAKRKGTPILF